MKLHAKSKASQKEAPNPKHQPLLKPSSNREAFGPPLKRKRDEESISVKQILKQNPDQKIYASEKGRKGNSEEKSNSPTALTLSVSFTSLLMFFFFFFMDESHFLLE